MIALLRQRGRVTYRTLQRQFQLDADALADLLGELRYTHQETLHEDEQGLIAESNLATATRVCDRLYAIDRGEIIFQGHPGEVFQNQDVIKTIRG